MLRLHDLRYLSRQEEAPEKESRRELLEHMLQTKEQIQYAFRGFNSAVDPALVESYVFEINSLQARYRYLLRQVRNSGGQTEERGESAAATPGEKQSV